MVFQVLDVVAHEVFERGGFFRADGAPRNLLEIVAHTRTGERVSVGTASGRTLPDCRCGSIAAMLPRAEEIWAEARSTHIGDSPL